jgi:hypothetical protein
MGFWTIMKKSQKVIRLAKKSGMDYAIPNIYAIGARIRRLPMTPTNVLEAIKSV